MNYTITTFYKFKEIESTRLLQERLETFGINNNLFGLVLVAPEGINGTIAGSSKAINDWKSLLSDEFSGITFKDSYSEKMPFKRWLVKVKENIVNIGRSDIKPDENDKSHISPDEWNEMIKRDDVVILDTRNTYETEIGKFKNALDPNIRTFSDFPEFVENSQISKDKTILMYCTGGIRCEKASVEMKRQGYKNVYQLKGGILQYLKEHPDEEWVGECFVFDHRVAVDQHLTPSTKYGACPHTGDPGEIDVTCEICGNSAKVRYTCTDIQKRTCSKDCAERLRRHEIKSHE